MPSDLRPQTWTRMNMRHLPTSSAHECRTELYLRTASIYSMRNRARRKRRRDNLFLAWEVPDGDIVAALPALFLMNRRNPKAMGSKAQRKTSNKNSNDSPKTRLSFQVHKYPWWMRVAKRRTLTSVHLWQYKSLQKLEQLGRFTSRRQRQQENLLPVYNR